MPITDLSLTVPEVYLPNISLKRCWPGQKTTSVPSEKSLAFSAWQEVLHWSGWAKYDSFLQFCSSAGSDWPLSMMVLVVICTCDLLPLQRKLMSALVLPHTYSWDHTALKLFLESEAVGCIWAPFSVLWGTGSSLWKTAAPKALFPLKLPSKPAWSECSWYWVCGPGDTLIFCLALLAAYSPAVLWPEGQQLPVGQVMQPLGQPAATLGFMLPLQTGRSFGCTCSRTFCCFVPPDLTFVNGKREIWCHVLWWTLQIDVLCV